MTKSNLSHSSPLPTCFRPPTTTTTTTTNQHSIKAAAPPPNSTSPNLTTSVYHTHVGLFALTWSRTPLGRSLHLHLLLNNHPATSSNPTLSPPLSSPPSFHLHIKPFIFWNKQGSKKIKLTSTKTAYVFWDLSKAKFESRPEPQSGYYIAAVVDGEMTLLAGDSPAEAYSKTRAHPPQMPEKSQPVVLRREHVYGNKLLLYKTKADFGGKNRDISIDFSRAGEDSRLYFSVENKRVLKIRHLKWKFRGNERVEVDAGVHVNISWDVYNWLFEEDDQSGFALFTFRFDEEESQRLGGVGGYLSEGDGGMFWSHEQSSCGFGFEKKKMKKKKSLLGGTRSSSSSSASLSSASSGCGSVMEWESVEENELKDPSGFSLLVYAWKR